MTDGLVTIGGREEDSRRRPPRPEWLRIKLKTPARYHGVRKLVEGLPGEQRDVVLLSFFEGLSHAEIGERLQLPLGTVKSRMRLAFAKLRSALGD